MGALLVLVTACGSSPGVQASIGPSGGSLAMENPSVRFDVPAGALTSDTLVSMRASTDPQSVLVTLEPAQLALAKPGQLAVSLSGTPHISGVAELTVAGEQPIGVDARVEDASGVSARLGLDHLTRVRIMTADAPDGGTAPGVCHDDHDRRHRGEGDGDDGDGHHDGDGDGGHHDGEDGEHHDGGVRGDGGVLASDECPDGFECDDGVCVAHGGNHEHDDDCRGMDAGTCHDDDDHDGGHDGDGDHRDGGHP
jgi:hypothetical protein